MEEVSKSRENSDMEITREEFKRLRRKLLMFFRVKGCRDPEELVCETFFRFTKSAARGTEFKNLEAFLLGTARNVLREHFRAKNKDQKILQAASESTMESGNESEGGEEEIRRGIESECMKLCLQKLSDDDRKLMVRYFKEEGILEEQRAKLSEKLGINIESLRVKISRKKRGLRDCYLKCMRRRNAF